MFLFLFLLVSPINGFNHQDCSKYQDEVVSGKHGGISGWGGCEGFKTQ